MAEQRNLKGMAAMNRRKGWRFNGFKQTRKSSQYTFKHIYVPNILWTAAITANSDNAMEIWYFLDRASFI